MFESGLRVFYYTHLWLPRLCKTLVFIDPVVRSGQGADERNF